MGDLSWRFGEKEYRYVKEVLDSGFASGSCGNMNNRLERAFCNKFGTKYAITCNSGTTTLHLILSAFGIKYGDEVIVTPLTVISCMNAILYCNAIPVFVDIDSNTFLMDPKKIEEKITSRTKAIMAVHLYGQVCDMTSIMSIARKNNLLVIEDSAQCYFGKHNGKIGGTIGDAGSWSFENSKHLTTGDGGIICCNNEEIAIKIRKLGIQGYRNASASNGKIRVDKNIFQDPFYKRHDSFGFMYRLPEVAAAIGLAQIEKLDFFLEKRQKIGKLYNDIINITNCKWLVPQKINKEDEHSYYAFAVRFTKEGVGWQEFRHKYMDNGGDGIYAAWKLCYQEGSINDIKNRLNLIGLDNNFNTNDGICPIAEKLQPFLMQFTTNQKDEDEMEKQLDALYKTIKYFS